MNLFFVLKLKDLTRFIVFKYKESEIKEKRKNIIHLYLSNKKKGISLYCFFSV